MFATPLAGDYVRFSSRDARRQNKLEPAPAPRFCWAPAASHILGRSSTRSAPRAPMIKAAVVSTDMFLAMAKPATAGVALKLIEEMGLEVDDELMKSAHKDGVRPSRRRSGADAIGHHEARRAAALHDVARPMSDHDKGAGVVSADPRWPSFGDVRASP